MPYRIDLELISCDVNHFLTKLVFNILNGPECFSGLGDTHSMIYLNKGAVPNRPGIQEYPGRCFRKRQDRYPAK